MDNINKKIDELLKIRQEGMYNYSKTTRELIDMGVKIGRHGTGDITISSAFDSYIDQYNRSNLEFEWEVSYKDGSKLRQFEGEEEHHFGHIDQSRIKSISFISNFVYPTDNVEKRIIATLNWETGLFEFMNGFASQEVRAHACMNPIEGNKKLILFSRKRYSAATGEINDKYKEFFPLMDEFFYYNRFVLGYEVNGKQKVVIIEPNGDIKIFEK